jgi:hypothetical protein
VLGATINIIAISALLSATLASSTPPPVRSLPGSSYVRVPAEQALRQARQMGPGTCEDLQKIEGLPGPGQYGWDPYFDRIMVHFPKYRACLVEATADARPAHVTGVPGLLPRSIGDLAHVLLVYGGALSWDACFPKAVLRHIGVTYETSEYAWLAVPSHRRQWHKCVVRKGGT